MKMKLLLGPLFIFILSKVNHMKADDDVEEIRARILENSYRPFLANTFERSIGDYEMHSNDKGMELSSCESCGMANIKKQIRTSIIGGDDVSPPDKYPWMVKIESYIKNGKGYLTQFCAGAIVSEYFILTAAHCIVKNRYTQEYFDPELVNVTFVTSTYKVQQGPPVEKVIPHPEYVEVVKHDIALLKLKEKIVCDRFKRPICLPPPDFVLPKGAIVIASGWGFTEAGRFSISEKLKESTIKVHDVCRLPRMMVKDIHLCFTGINRQVTCNGDSGGPAFYKHDNKFYVIGVLSAGPPCSVRNPLSYYTSVSKHLSWIHENMRTSSQNPMTFNAADGGYFGEKQYGGYGGYGGPDY